MDCAVGLDPFIADAWSGWELATGQSLFFGERRVETCFFAPIIGVDPICENLRRRKESLWAADERLAFPEIFGRAESAGTRCAFDSGG